MSNRMLYVITVLIWGSTWLAIEYQLGVVPPEISVVYRFSGAAALLFGWSRVRGLPLRFPLRVHGWFVLLGLLLFCLNYVFTYRAQVYITSALTAILFCAMVWLNILNARLFFGMRAGLRVQAGALLGMTGIIVLFVPRMGGLTLSDEVFRGAALALAGAFIASLGNMVSQKAQRLQLPVIQSNAWGMFYGAAASAALAMIEGREFVFDISAAYVVSLLYLTVFGTIVAFGAYLTLLGRIGAHKAGYVVVMFPLVALALSVLFEGLKVDAPLLIGAGLVVAGNLFVLSPAPNGRRLRRTAATAAITAARAADRE